MKFWIAVPQNHESRLCQGWVNRGGEPMIRPILLTVLFVLLALFFGFWGIQTAWIGSLTNQNPSDYEIWATVLLGLGLLFFLLPFVLWMMVWRKWSNTWWWSRAGVAYLFTTVFCIYLTAQPKQKIKVFYHVSIVIFYRCYLFDLITCTKSAYNAPRLNLAIVALKLLF